MKWFKKKFILFRLDACVLGRLNSIYIYIYSQQLIDTHTHLYIHTSILIYHVRTSVANPFFVRMTEKFMQPWDLKMLRGNLANDEIHSKI